WRESVQAAARAAMRPAARSRALRTRWIWSLVFETETHRQRRIRKGVGQWRQRPWVQHRAQGRRFQACRAARFEDRRVRDRAVAHDCEPDEAGALRALVWIPCRSDARD